jgi:D-alanyl-D-alanine carboxypeptidase/D-alanyl-D-alanine-endopeptidase (penicillin-binding protein 4)
LKPRLTGMPVGLKGLCAVFLAFLLLGGSVPTDAVEGQLRPQGSYQTLEGIIANWLKRPELQNSMIGIEVMELPSGRILYSLNGNKRFVSASTAKVLTTACAYDAFGANFHYSTRLYGTGAESPKKVAGNIVLQPSQDPTLTREDVRQMFVSLSQKGMNQVEGGLLVGTVNGGGDQWLTGWLTEDWGQEWMPPSSNLAIDRNIAQGNVVLKGFRNTNLGPENAFNAASQALLLAGESAAWIECDQPNHELTFYRSPGMAMGAPLVVANPTSFNTALAVTCASDAGVRFTNRSIKDKTCYPIVEHQSKPLSLIIQTCLHKSDNFYAQQILRTLGLAKVDSEPEGIARDYRETYPIQQSQLEARGLARLGSWLQKIGVPASEFVMFDGCGLSRKDGISPHTLNTVLKHMATPTMNGPYLQLLRRYSPVNKTDAWYACKTGSMDTARSVSGVLETIGGQYCAVTIMVNGHRASVGALKGEIDSLVGILDCIKSIKFEPTKLAGPAAGLGSGNAGAGKGAGGGTGTTGAAGAGSSATTKSTLPATGGTTPNAGDTQQTSSGGDVTMVELARVGSGGRAKGAHKSTTTRRARR